MERPIHEMLRIAHTEPNKWVDQKSIGWGADGTSLELRLFLSKIPVRIEVLITMLLLDSVRRILMVKAPLLPERSAPDQVQCDLER